MESKVEKLQEALERAKALLALKNVGIITSDEFKDAIRKIREELGLHPKRYD